MDIYMDIYNAQNSFLKSSWKIQQILLIFLLSSDTQPIQNKKRNVMNVIKKNTFISFVLLVIKQVIIETCNGLRPPIITLAICKKSAK
jgi:hypothetical protein